MNTTNIQKTPAQEWEDLKQVRHSLKAHGLTIPCTPELDMSMMHRYYGVKEMLAKLSPEMLHAFIDFRIGCMEEELAETREAFVDLDADGVVDGAIDLMVFTVGFLELMGVNFEEAWHRVLIANMNKKVGIKDGRPNPFGLPDLIKNAEWEHPGHMDNVGLIGDVFAKIREKRDYTA